MLIFNDLAQHVRDQLAAYGVCNGRIDVNREEPATSGKMPAANVFAGDDSGEADGDVRAGPPEFVHTLKLVVEIVDVERDGEALLTRLSRHGADVTDCLFCDLAWGNHPGAQIEGIASVKQIRVNEPRGDRKLGRVQIIIEVVHRSVFLPRTPAASLSTIQFNGPGDLRADFDLATD